MNIDLERFRFGSDVDFIKALLIEESVFVMPGKVVNISVSIVVCLNHRLCV